MLSISQPPMLENIMPTRILIEKERIRISKPGYDVYSENLEDFVLHEKMGVMAVYLSSSCTLSGEDARYYFNLPKPILTMPYVIMTSNDGTAAGRSSYFCEMRHDNNGRYSDGVIRNLDGKSRTIWFSVLRGF